MIFHITIGICKFLCSFSWKRLFFFRFEQTNNNQLWLFIVYFWFQLMLTDYLLIVLIMRIKLQWFHEKQYWRLIEFHWKSFTFQFERFSLGNTTKLIISFATNANWLFGSHEKKNSKEQWQASHLRKNINKRNALNNKNSIRNWFW